MQNHCTEKHCYVCGTTKPIDEFYNCKTSKDGKQTRCKTCFKEYSKKWYTKKATEKGVVSHHWLSILPNGKVRSEFRIWDGILQRCLNENSPAYQSYGGRGISVCERWRTSFENFFADMGEKPSPLHTIDRIDNNGNYEPDNCRWATKKEQGRNKRNNKRIVFRGEEKTLSEWGEIFGLSSSIIGSRIFRYGWTVEQAITTPLGTNGGYRIKGTKAQCVPR
jgi:hypothetical protein